MKSLSLFIHFPVLHLDSKSTDNIRSLLDSKRCPSSGRASPPQQQFSKLFTLSDEQAATKQNPIGANLKLPQSKWNSFGNAATPQPRNIERSTNITTSNTTTTLSSGSFEEPYEFYWSGDEAGSEVQAAPPITNTHKCTDKSNNYHLSATIDKLNDLFTVSTTTAASVSSIDDDGLDDLGSEAVLSERKAPIAPIGSEAVSAQFMRCGDGYENRKTEQISSADGKKRPNLLK